MVFYVAIYGRIQSHYRNDDHVFWMYLCEDVATYVAAGGAATYQRVTISYVVVMGVEIVSVFESVEYCLLIID